MDRLQGAIAGEMPLGSPSTLCAGGRGIPRAGSPGCTSSVVLSRSSCWICPVPLSSLPSSVPLVSLLFSVLFHQALSNLISVSPSFPLSIPVSLLPFSPYKNYFPLFCSSFWIPTPFLLFTPICHPLPLVSPNSRDQQSLLPSPLSVCHPLRHSGSQPLFLLSSLHPLSPSSLFSHFLAVILVWELSLQSQAKFVPSQFPKPVSCLVGVPSGWLTSSAVADRCLHDSVCSTDLATLAAQHPVYLPNTYHMGFFQRLMTWSHLGGFSRESKRCVFDYKATPCQTAWPCSSFGLLDITLQCWKSWMTSQLCLLITLVFHWQTLFFLPCWTNFGWKKKIVSVADIQNLKFHPT